MNEVMSEDTLEQAVVESLAATVGIEPSEIDLDAPLMTIPDIDSMLLLASLAEIENRCGVMVPDDVLFRANNARELVHLIGELKAGA